MDEHESDRFWEDPDVVERFASRSPDHRLQRLMQEVEGLSGFHALDVGCAGGRNALYLARIGVDVHAVDTSPAMVARTRSRLAEVLGTSEARARVLRAPMDDLGHVPDASIDLVVILGVLQSARSVGEWNEAVKEIRRVLKTGGRALVSNFDPSSQPRGQPLVVLEGEPHRYVWRENQQMILVDPSRHDAAFAGHGLVPAEPTQTVHVPLENGYRISINALYRAE